MAELPDTTAAVAAHFLSLPQDVFDPDDWPEGNEEALYQRIAEIAVVADRNALADVGAEILMPGQVPSWMSEVRGAGWRDESPYGVSVNRSSKRGDTRPADTAPLYRNTVES